MKKTQVHEYYIFGRFVGILFEHDPVQHGKEDCLRRYDLILGYLDELELRVTAKAAEGLRKALQVLRDNTDSKITNEQAEAIKDAYAAIENTLEAELQTKDIYVLTSKRYPLETLMAKPEALLAEGVHDRLTETAKQDYKLACIQVALAQPTAAAFHLMRMLEECVKVLYTHFKRTKRLEKPMWGPMIQQLRAKSTNRPTEKLLSHLDGIRQHFRNPTQHPESFYSIDESQDLLNQTVAATNMIYAEIPVSK